MRIITTNVRIKYCYPGAICTDKNHIVFMIVMVFSVITFCITEAFDNITDFSITEKLFF